MIGHWIGVENDDMGIVGYYCSECDAPMETEEKSNFCPWCGANMQAKGFVLDVPDNATNREVFNTVFSADDLTEMVDIIDTFHGGKTVILDKHWGDQLYNEYKEL